jgi:EAL domain-containing protein (putative c-di-GMP-specific phosphodiesterase class I)
MVDKPNDELERTLRELAASAKDSRRSPARAPQIETAPPIVPEPASAPVVAEAPPPSTDIGLDEAMRETWLEVWYQPKIDLRLKCLAGAEALARVHHPQHGLQWPESFLKEADEESMAQLTEHALLAVLADWELFDQAGFNLRLAMNLPVDHLLKLPIADIVAKNRPSAPHWPGLIVEVREDQIVRDIKAAQQVAGKLKENGVSVSIDDFGAGFSSFATLRDFPFAELELNHGFVKNCAGDTTNAAICQTVIDLSHRFGSAAVASGIETMADLSALQIMGCDFGQGVLLAPPMPRDRLIAMLRQRMNKPQATPEAQTAPPAAAAVG